MINNDHVAISVEYPYTTPLGKILCPATVLLERRQMLIFGCGLGVGWGTFTENQDEYYICTPIHTPGTNMLILGKMFANV